MIAACQPKCGLSWAEWIPTTSIRSSPVRSVQWPKYGATYRGQFYTIAPMPTDDGRWLLSIDGWTDESELHSTVIAALDAALERIKAFVDETAEPDRIDR